MLKKVLVGSLVAVVVLVGAAGGLLWWKLQPRDQDLKLHPTQLSVKSEEGAAILERASARADYDTLERAWQSQELGSWCGVASGTSVVNALGGSATQDSFFNDETDEVISKLGVTLGGMTLAQLGGLLRKHGMAVDMQHASDLDLDRFRTALVRNLQTSGDYVLVNYDRKTAHQIGAGHISPVAAYDAETDRFLVLDTASYKYPWFWIDAQTLFAAANTTDSTSGKSRGFVLVGRGS
jgi:hypothetical protein